ncbi:MAG: hypothetical protein OXB94_03270 [Nitrospira sp.]|nr:hypothetical protein [Nitrospira sp.]
MRWRAVILAAFLLWPHVLFAADFTNLLQNKAPQALVSDKDATVFFLKTFGASLELPKGLLQRRRDHSPLPNGLTQHLSPLVANLATWHLTNDLLAALDQGNASTIRSVLDRRQQQLKWLTPSQPDLPALMALAGTIAQLQRPDPTTQPLSPHDSVFTLWLHEHYPNWTGTPDSWLTLAQTEGTAGVKKRLRDSWDRLTAQDGRQEKPLQEDPAPSIHRFLRHFFLPITTAHVRATLLQLHVGNERRAWKHWQAIRQWSHDRKNEQGLQRLCGTWQWLIHNHQNHGDHKTVMVYPPPSQYHRMDPQPATIQVQGDTVYIRWEFPRGIVQEESLLLSEKDQLLSGSFVNNLGPNGNITGRRIKPCREIGG